AFGLPLALLIALVPPALGLIPRAPRRMLLAACRFIVIYVVIAAVFLPSWTPALDGNEQFAEGLSRASIQSHLVLGMLAVGIVIALWRWPDGAGVLSQAIFVTALGFVGYALIADPKHEEHQIRARTEQDIERLLTFSSRRNTLIVLMDSFQGDLFAELLDEDRDLAQRFDGFVYYPNITAVAPITLGALPAIYSGRIYTGGPLREFYKDVYRDTIFSDARKAGYSTVLYGHYYFGCPAESCVKLPVLLQGLDRPILASYMGLLDYGLLRISPTSLHDLIYHDGLALSKQPPTMKTQAIDSLRGLKTITERSRVGDEAPTFKFLHLMNTHFPLNIDEECKIAPQRPRTRSNFKVQARCGLDAFLRLVAFLERSSIYDSGLIILMSDHGSSLSEPSQPRTLDQKMKLYSGRAAFFLPLFLVKPPGSRGPLRISQAPASLIDLRATVCEATQTCEPPAHGVSVLSLPEDTKRERVFIEYRNPVGIAQRNGLRDEEIQTFTLSGSVEDLDQVRDSAGRPLR
ncbi:MAG: sulfatase-like hydrolase/transferase, partial [Gammaproteobacteria bacterium]